MKILGVKNSTHFVASVSHYDYVAHEDLMADGGVVGLQGYAGYNRFIGESVWVEIPQNFAELKQDYEFGKPRKYGVWRLEDVRILEKREWPNPRSLKWKAENAYWGTRGKDGKDPLVYKLMTDLSSDHLEAILETQDLDKNTTRIIQHILTKRES